MGAARTGLYHPLVPAAELDPPGDNVDLGAVSTGVVGTSRGNPP